MTGLSARRLCFFSSDSYGLAHVIRNTRIANHTVARSDGTTALIISGVATSSFPPLVPGCDYLRMPAVLRLSDGQHESISLRIPYADLRRLRSIVLATTVDELHPSVLVVDHLSRNIQQEIQPLMERLAASDGSRPWRILAFNDILNHPDQVRAKWYDTGLFDFAAAHFDEIWIYGERDFYSWEDHYSMPTAFVRKLRYMGFLTEALSEQEISTIRRRVLTELAPGLEPKYIVLLTTGGGHDGSDVIGRYLDVLEAGALDDVFSVIVSGPLIERQQLGRLSARAAELGSDRVHFREFAPDLEDLIRSSDAVVSMGGCTLAEVLAAGKPSIVVPRVQWASSQQVRAELIERLGWGQLVQLQTASVRSFGDAVNVMLKDPWEGPRMMFRGLDMTSTRLLELPA
jgi:predicted glycosyltransferase